MQLETACFWEETSDTSLSEGPKLEQERTRTLVLHLVMRAKQHHGWGMWKGPGEGCSICDLAIPSFCIANIGQTILQSKIFL